MKRTPNYNINSRTYWNNEYGNLLKRESYSVQTTERVSTGRVVVSPTFRFATALKEIKPEDKVLDMGCGVGNFTKLVKKTNPLSEVWGVDISDQAILDNANANPDIKYIQGHIGKLDLPQDYFDVIFCGEVIEHLDNPQDAFLEAYKALKTGGKFVLTTPLEDAIHSGEHVWYFNKEDIIKLFTDSGFSSPEFIDLPDLEYLVVIFAVGVKNES